MSELPNMAPTDLFPEPEILALLGVVAATVVFVVDARRRRTHAALIAAAAIDFFVGLMSLLLSSFHLIAVSSRAVSGRGLGGAAAFAYDFRFYSLVLLGVLIAAPSLVCVVSARGLTRSDATAWKRALWSSVFLLAINIPLMPIQGFAIGLSAFALLNLATLMWARGRLRSAAE